MKVQNKDGKGNPWHSDKNGQFTTSNGETSGSIGEKDDKTLEKTLDNNEKSNYNNVEKQIKANGSGSAKFVGVIDKLQSFKTKEQNNSYDYETGEVVSFDDGFMVSFHQNQDDGFGGYMNHFGRYTPEEYDRMATEFANENNVDATTIGVYGNQPEISFKVKTRKQAWQLMIEHNQESIYDNKRDKLIMNPYYVPEKNPMPKKGEKDNYDIIRLLQKT